MHQKTTHDSLPAAVDYLINKIDHFELMFTNFCKQPLENKNEYKGIEYAMARLHLSRQTIYALCSQKKLKNFKPNKFLLFKEDDLNEFIEAAKQKTIKELQNEAEYAMLKNCRINKNK